MGQGRGAVKIEPRIAVGVALVVGVLLYARSASAGTLGAAGGAAAPRGVSFGGIGGGASSLAADGASPAAANPLSTLLQGVLSAFQPAASSAPAASFPSAYSSAALASVSAATAADVATPAYSTADYTAPGSGAQPWGASYLSPLEESSRIAIDRDVVPIGAVQYLSPLEQSSRQAIDRDVVPLDAPRYLSELEQVSRTAIDRSEPV